MHRAPLTTLLAAVLAATLILPAPSAHAKPRSCPTMFLRGEPVRIAIERGAVTCRRAKTIARRCVRFDAPCQGNGCFRTIGRWTCGGGNRGAGIVFGCNRGRGRVFRVVRNGT